MVAASNPNVILHGFLKEEKLNELLEQMDILVCPSIWGEPFGRVIIDAYKSCVPVVATNCGGLPELIENGVTGMLVKPNSASEILSAIQKFIGGGGTGTPSTVSAIREKLEDFSIVAQGEHFEQLFEEIIIQSGD